MGNWSGVITNVGKTLLTGWVEGKTLNISSAAAGTGVVEASAMMAQTSLVTQKQTMSVLSSSVTATGRKIKLQLTAPETAYTLNQIGVYGQLNSDTPVLLALYQNTTGVSIPSVSTSPDFVYTFFAVLSISNQGSFTITIDTSALVTQDTLDEAIDDIEDEIDTKADIPLKTTISLPKASWVGSASPYSQVITVTGSTANSKIDLQPDGTALAQMLNDGTNAMFVENNNNVLTVYAVGEKPTADLSIQGTMYEVTA